jgi:hypothetical protein
LLPHLLQASPNGSSLNTLTSTLFDDHIRLDCVESVL